MSSPKKFEENQYPFFLKPCSFYNLPLDEFRDKPLDNLDHDLINNKIYSQECRILKNLSSSSSSSSSPSMFHENNLNARVGVIKSTINPTKMDITLDEYLGSQDGFVHNSAPLMSKMDSEMDISQWQQHEVFMPMPVQAVVESDFPISENVFDNKKMDLEYFGQELDKLSDLQGHTEKKKRVLTDEVMEKTIEKKHRRMIKNRESAARSRARKQAYTNHLLHSVEQLQAINKWLKKKKEVEMHLSSSSPSGPRYQLRRTSSARF